MTQSLNRADGSGANLYIDTRGCCTEPAAFTEAVINGLAQGGGLYVPQEIPSLSVDEIVALADLSYAQRAAAIYKAFNIDLPDEEIDRLMERSYGANFDDEAICPITSLDENTHVLELWHGPLSRISSNRSVSRGLPSLGNRSRKAPAGSGSNFVPAGKPCYQEAPRAPAESISFKYATRYPLVHVHNALGFGRGARANLVPHN